MLILIVIGMLLVVFVTACGMAFTSFNATETTRSRLQRVSGQAVLRTPLAEPGQSPLRQGLNRLLEILSGNPETAARDSTYAARRQRLIEAGFRRPGAFRMYMGSRVAATLGLAALTFPTSIFLDDTLLAFAILAVAAGIGFLAPGLVVDARRSARHQAIVRSLPDAIDLMVVCVEAGLSLAATLDRVAKEFFRSNPVLAGELKLAVLETQAGKSLSEALRALAARNGVADLATLTSSLVQTERLGTRVADTLRVQADALRTRRLQQAEEAAQRAPVKMLLPAAMFIFPAVLIVVLVPAFSGALGVFE